MEEFWRNLERKWNLEGLLEIPLILERDVLILAQRWKSVGNVWLKHSMYEKTVRKVGKSVRVRF